MSIIPTLIKGVKGSKKLKKILEGIESSDRRKTGNPNLNTKLESLEDWITDFRNNCREI